MRAWILGTFGCVACLLAVNALAASTPDEDVTARQTALKSIGKTFKEIYGIKAGDVVAQRTLLVSDANQLKTLSTQPWSHFGPETATTTIKNQALPVIWSDAAGFHAAQTKMIDAIAALDAVAASGAPDVVEQKIAEVGASCGGCHKVFRAK